MSSLLDISNMTGEAAQLPSLFRQVKDETGLLLQVNSHEVTL